MTNVNSASGANRLAIEPSIRDSHNARVKRLYPLIAAIIEDAISVRLVCEEFRTNQAYMLARFKIESAAQSRFIGRSDFSPSVESRGRLPFETT
jgi:hypothetical protein